jgi:hypothetical protein
MMKMAAQVAAAGLAGIVALKVVGLFVIPIIGLIAGLLGVLLRIGLVMAVGYFVLTLLKRVRGEDELEIEVEVEEVD